MTALEQAIGGHRTYAALRLLVAGALAVTIAGCNQTGVVADPYPIDYRERHPITLKEGTQTLEVFLGRNRGGLTPDQRADVLAFAQQWRKEATGGIVIDVPRAPSYTRAANDSLREIYSIFAASGVPRGAVRVAHYSPERDTLASIKINYARLVADAGPCGLWPSDLGPAGGPGYVSNYPYWNFGCATQRNLASMVANPADLVQPRGEMPAYSARRSVAIDNYRKGDNPGGTYSGYDTGKISDLGK